ncbi:MAG: hypothetical protein KGO93_07590 [Cyanobacteria bacterium REEB446]|nr:hypothetical protein [Cyanobacteria bacterium REEB446]
MEVLKSSSLPSTSTMLSEEDYKDLIKHLGYEGQEYRLYFSIVSNRKSQNEEERKAREARKKLDTSTKYILEHRQHFINYNFKNHPAKMDVQHKKIHGEIYLDPWDLLDKNNCNLRNINSKTRKEYYYSSMADHIFFQIIKDNTEENFRVFAGNVGRLLILLEMCYLRPQNIVITNLTSSYYHSPFAPVAIYISGITEEFEDDCFSRAVSSFPCLYCGQPLIRDCSSDYSNSVVYDYLYFCNKKCMENLLDRKSIKKIFVDDDYSLSQLKKKSCDIANLREEAAKIIQSLKKLISKKVRKSASIAKFPHEPIPLHSVIIEILRKDDFLKSLKKLADKELHENGIRQGNSIYLEKGKFYKHLKGYLGAELQLTWPKFVLRSLQILKLLNEKVNSRDGLRSHYTKSDNSKIHFEFYYQN